MEVLWVDDPDGHVSPIGAIGLGDWDYGVGGGGSECGLPCHGETGAGFSNYAGQADS